MEGRGTCTISVGPLNDITVSSLISDNIKHYTNLKVKQLDVIRT